MSLMLASPAGAFLSLDQNTTQIVLIVTAGVAALIIIILAALLLARWWVRRKRQPGGAPQPMEAPELYDLRTADVTEDVRFCVEMARAVGGPVLELGAGTGRVTLPLARTGLVVTGLETSRLMLQRAKMKAEQLSAKLHVEWVEGDITNFALGGRKFRLILAPFNVLQELRDLSEMEKCLRCVADHLEPTGKFVVMVQPPRWETLKVERRFLKAVYNPRTSELVNCYQSLEIDPIWQKLRGEYEYEIWDHAGHARQMVAPFEGSYLTCPEMALLLRAAGLQLESAYGSFERDKLTAQSKHMIFVGRLLPAAALPAPSQASAPVVKQPAPVPALVAAGASSARASASSASLPAALPPVPATAILPETVASSASGAAGSSPASAAGSASLPALPPGGSSASSTAGSSPAQGLQAPPSAPAGHHTGGQRRRSKPTR